MIAVPDNIDLRAISHSPGLTSVHCPTPHYTLGELEDAISALAEAPDAQLVMALARFLGLRPSEISGLKWEDFGPNEVHIRRAVTRGIVGDTKTPESVDTLPLIAPVKIPLALWKAKSGSPQEGWAFPKRGGKPIDMREFCRRRIRPLLAKKNVKWKGLYAGRRAAATILTQLTGNPIAASQLLRHRNMSVTMSAHIKADRKALTLGLKLLEEKTSKET